MPDDLRTESLAAASQTLLRGSAETETLRAQLAQAASLLRALPAQPAVPSVVFRRADANVPESVEIGPGISIGRGDGCDVRFDGRKDLSRQHFMVRAVKDHFVVEDLGSANGTSIEGVPAPVQRRELRDGDLIRAGGMVFLFVRSCV